jgi:hypothetical protein
MGTSKIRKSGGQAGDGVAEGHLNAVEGESRGERMMPFSVAGGR